MKFRKKHKGESGEVFTDSLNDILFILLMLAWYNGLISPHGIK